MPFWWSVLGLCLLLTLCKGYSLSWWYLLLVGFVILRVFSFMGVGELDGVLDNGDVVIVSGEICLEPDIRRNDVRYVVCSDEFDTRILWKDDLENMFEIGDEVVLNCVLEEPFEEDGFSYKNYLRIFKVEGLCVGELIEFVRGGFDLRKSILRFKNYTIGYFDDVLLEPVSSLMNGIILGSRRGFAEDIMDDFARTGLTHIIAVSGYNVALVLLVIEKLFWWVPRRSRFYIEVLSLVGFAFLTGLSASVLRACIMGVLTLWGVRSGNVRNFWRILLVCVLMMGFWNPAYLYFDASFHLSVLATIGVVMGGKIIDFDPEKDFLGLKEAFLMTMFAQVFTTPLILLKFDYFSLVSPVANVLVAPFLPVLMFLGVLVFLGEFIFPFGVFTWLVVFIIEILGRVFFVIVELVSRWEFLVVELDGLDRGLLVSLYVLVMILLLSAYVWRKNQAISSSDTSSSS